MRRERTLTAVCGLALVAWLLSAADGLLAGEGAAVAGEGATDESAGEDVGEWRRERLEGLRSSDGWLTLAGLFWLQEGESLCGSDPSSDVIFPASVPPRLGILRRTGDTVELETGPGVAVTVDGTKRRKMTLATDASGEPTIVEYGAVKFYLIARQGPDGDQIGVRIKDGEHPALRDFEGLDYYPVDPRWQLEVDFEPYDPPKAIPVPTVLGNAIDQESPGALVFRMAARTLRLDTLPGGEGELFIVFGDATNGKGTYGGGRFLYASGPDDAGRVRLDFNKAYNPPCAFTPFATCPLPPPQNKLALAVRAGEKSYAGH